MVKFIYIHIFYIHIFFIYTCVCVLQLHLCGVLKTLGVFKLVMAGVCETELPRFGGKLLGCQAGFGGVTAERVTTETAKGGSAIPR